MATDTLVWKRLLLLSLLLYWPQVYVDVEVPKQDYVIHSNINLLFIDLHVLVLKKGGRKKKKHSRQGILSATSKKLCQRQRTHVQYKAPGNQLRVQVIWWKRLLCTASDSMYLNQVLLRTRTTKRLLSFVEVHTFIEFCWLTCRNSLHNRVCDFL